MAVMVVRKEIRMMNWIIVVRIEERMKKIHSLKHKSSTQENHNPKLKSEKKILNESKKMENKDKGTVPGINKRCNNYK